MEQIILDILSHLENESILEPKQLEKILRKHNRNIKDNNDHYSKKKLLPYYLKVKKNNPELWNSWNIAPETEKKLFEVLQIKPRRTASGVATITVITKPWKCDSNCIYCPNDLRMPKSYLSDEPACQRAERNYFDPYLQVTSRLRALTHMGHVTDKIELIILGGTWADYPAEYQTWFVKELFRALNDGEEAEINARKRRDFYKKQGLAYDKDELIEQCSPYTKQVHEGKLTYNQAWEKLYGKNTLWDELSAFQTTTLDEVKEQHALNESANHRVVGLVVETRPDTITPQSLNLIRTLGCTKIQMGVQTLDPAIQKANKRSISPEAVARAFKLTRIYGFKIHAHFMVNLLGSTPEKDIHDYQRFVSEEPFQPDEIKLYPCALVYGTKLCENFDNGTWQPYDHETLVDILVEDTCATPAFTRVSRMIRDFSAHDIKAGNKKINLRQNVEEKALAKSLRDQKPIQEIRFRELNASQITPDDLVLDIVSYQTQGTQEYFLQWITSNNTIAGFLRLSLPNQEEIQTLNAQANEEGFFFPINPKEAMIREIHVYGSVAGIGKNSTGAQHLGLGKSLVKKACEIASEQGYEYLNVISAIGTRPYYRKLGFVDKGLYQQLALN
ncbi:MAG: elongator complex protein 3 [Anaerotardibacter sp.]